jgi:riboflavin synthase
MKETLFSTYKKGTKVNIETDMFARYIEHILHAKQKQNTLNWNDIDKISAIY